MQVTKVLERRYVSDDQVRDRVLDSMRGASGRDMPLFGTGYVLQGKRISRRAECTNPMSCLVFFPVCTRTDAPFSLPTVVEMVEAVVKQASDDGIFGSAVKAAFRIMHGRELPTKFGGQNMRLGDIMQMSRRIVMTVVNTQPLYKYVACVCVGVLCLVFDVAVCVCTCDTTGTKKQVPGPSGIEGGTSYHGRQPCDTRGRHGTHAY